MSKDAPKNVSTKITNENSENEPEKTAQKFVVSEKLHRKLFAIRDSAVNTSKNIYKIKKMKSFPLVIPDNVVLKPSEKMLVPVQAKHHILSNVYCTAPSLKFRDHVQLFQMESIIDQDHQKIPIINYGDSNYTLKKGTKIAFAQELDFESLPFFENNFSDPLENIFISALSDDTENLSPKELAQNEFEKELKSYPEDQRNFLKNYSDIFVPKEAYVLPKLKIPPIKVKTKSTEIKPTPPFPKRNYSRADEQAIDIFIETGLLNGLIEHVGENNPTATLSPLHVVRRGSKTRVCLDCRVCNDLNIESFSYIFPSIVEEVNFLAKDNFESYFSADCVGAFNQLELDEESRNLMAFPCYTDKNRGLYRATRLMFGIKSAPAIFSCVLDNILRGLNQPHIKANIRSYLDDIAGNAQNDEEQMKFLKIFFERLRKAGIILSAKKSKFFQKSIAFCGVVIDKNGYRINDKRVKLLDDYPDLDVASKTKNALLKHCGFYNWHRKFAANYSTEEQKIRKVFHKYEKGHVKREEANAEIKRISDALKTTIRNSVLVAPGKNDVVTIESDASLENWGSVCYTDSGIISYGGGKFPPSICKSHSIFEKEIFSLAKAVQDSHIYLNQCNSIILKNDNIACVLSANKIKQKLTSRALKYLMTIQNFTDGLDCEIIWINSRANLLSDTLSRLNYDSEGNVVLDHEEEQEHDISFFEKNDQRISQIEYLTDLHARTHWSLQKMQKTAKLLGYETQPKELQKIFMNCKKCYKYRQLGPKCKLNAHENAARPMQELHVDFIDKSKPNLISNNGHTGILTITDNLSRFLIASAETSLRIAPVIDRLRLLMGTTGRRIEKLYCDNAFKSSKFKEFCIKDGIILKFRPSNLSRSVRVERKHKDLHPKLKAFSKKANDWDEVLPHAVASLNAQISDVTGFTPHYLFYGSENSDLGGRFDPFYESNLILAKKVADLHRRNENHVFRSVPPGTEVLIKYTNDKNEKGLSAVVKSDDGASSLVVTLNGKEQSIHKGHIYIAKNSDVYENLFA